MLDSKDKKLPREKPKSQLFQAMLANDYDKPVIFLTGQGDESIAVNAMKMGVQDYLIKGQITSASLYRAILNAIEKSTMLRKIEDHQRELYAVNLKMMADLEQARSLQQAILPHSFIQFPRATVATRFIPVEKVGGDFYDVLLLPEDKIGIMIADVTGHGVSAAMLSFMIYGLFKTFAFENSSPARTLQRLNDALYQKIPDEKFATLFYAIYDPHRQSLFYASAGHPPGVYIRSRQPDVELLDRHGALLGIIPSDLARFEDTQIPFYPGDKLVLFTDGLLEIENEKHELFGLKRCKNLLSAAYDRSITDIMETLLTHAMEFSGNTELNDDLTMVGIEACDSE
ncbi:MAG: SpoIIE family protein phosphatase [SAR324 cluster bacterium]|nr:SpoIIE family protein phosphatase [SAR324 cluster bacterium]